MKNLDQFKNDQDVDVTKPHVNDKEAGADDQEYILMMEMYKRLRRVGKKQKEANELLEKIFELGRNGDVSKKAKIAAAYM